MIKDCNEVLSTFNNYVVSVIVWYDIFICLREQLAINCHAVLMTLWLFTWHKFKVYIRGIHVKKKKQNKPISQFFEVSWSTYLVQYFQLMIWVCKVETESSGRYQSSGINEIIHFLHTHVVPQQSTLFEYLSPVYQKI